MKIPWRRPPNRVLIPGILSLALGGLLLGVSDLGTLRSSLMLPFGIVAQLVALMIVYLIAKWFVWWRLLVRAGISPPWREAFFAYLGGEMTKSLPGGIYFQNYLLTKLSGHEVAVGIATSTVLVGMEAAVCMAITLAVGIPAWPWLRGLLAGIAVAWIVLLLSLWRSRWIERLTPWAQNHPNIKFGLYLASSFYRGIVSLWDPWLWASLIGLTAVYLLASGAQLYLIAHVLGDRALTFGQAQVTNAFSMLLPLMIPIPIQIGFAETTGAGALVALGLGIRQAIALMIAYRLWNNGLVFPLAIPVMLAMRPEWRRVMAAAGEKEEPC
jgi:hypothetical protein